MGVSLANWAVINTDLALTKCSVVLYPEPPPKRKGGSGEYSTASHHGLAVAMDSANWRCGK